MKFTWDRNKKRQTDLNPQIRFVDWDGRKAFPMMVFCGYNEALCIEQTYAMYPMGAPRNGFMGQVVSTREIQKDNETLVVYEIQRQEKPQ